eukprot:s968_g35.t2
MQNTWRIESSHEMDSEYATMRFGMAAQTLDRLKFERPFPPLFRLESLRWAACLLPFLFGPLQISRIDCKSLEQFSDRPMLGALYVM